MKKLSQNGFALAETLIVTVFLMVLFGMIYTNFLPLIGEYEKREVYDDIDGKYSIFWIKRLIETAEYNLKVDVINNQGFVRFQCHDLASGDSITMCKDIVKMLQVNNCDKEGNNCDIFISRYKIRSAEDDAQIYFKDVVNTNLKKSVEKNSISPSKTYHSICMNNNDESECNRQKSTNVFSDGFKTYLFYLPDYSKQSYNAAQYRVFAIFHNTKDGNNYYSYATIEINR